MIAKLRAKLLTSSDISTVEPYLRENAALPVVVYEVSSDDLERDLQQNSKLRRTGVTLRCMASSYSGADDLASAVDTVLQDWTETSPPIQAAERVSISRAFAVPVEASNEIIYEASVELVVHWKDE